MKNLAALTAVLALRRARRVHITGQQHRPGHR